MADAVGDKQAAALIHGDVVLPLLVQRGDEVQARIHQDVAGRDRAVAVNGDLAVGVVLLGRKLGVGVCRVPEY